LSALFLALLLLQGLPALPGRSGTVSGVVRTSTGGVAAGVRVSAMVPPESDIDLRSASSFSALAETDEAGRYRLEGIPPGRYYIVAGRVDGPTYYPGTTEMSKARIFSIPPEGGAVSGIDFTVVDSSVRVNVPQDLAGYISQLSLALPTSFSIPIKVEVEGGGKIPLIAPEGSVLVRLTNVGGGTPITRQVVNATTSLAVSPLPNLPPPEFRVGIDNLPVGYVVKSMKYGADDVMVAPLKIPAANMPRRTVMTVGGVTQQVVTTISPAGAPAPTLTITLATVPLPPITGVRVMGSMKDTEVRPVYLSGVPGILYSDGSFEFRGVTPGRYRLAAIGNPPAVASLGASIVVGDRDLESIELLETATLPADVKTPSIPGPVSSPATGSVLPLSSLRGRLTEEASGRPIEEGSIKLIGRNDAVAPIGPGGQFEFRRLLPGSYNLEIRIFGHTNILQPVVVGDEDLHVDVTTLRMY
jgi:hypothetical protein